MQGLLCRRIRIESALRCGDVDNSILRWRLSDISSLLHVADAQRLVTINVTRDLTILRYYFKAWVEDDLPLLVDSSSSDQAEDVVNDTTTEDTDSDSSDNVWEATITLIMFGRQL